MSAFFGNSDWKFLCTPPIPCKGVPANHAPFLAHDEPIAPFVAMIMGLQHALAMIGGIITVPLLVAGMFNANLGENQQQYLISASLIISGITSIIQVARIKIPFTSIIIGTGLVSVMGTSFTFLPIAVEALRQMKGKSEFLDAEGGFDGEKAYGAILGTILVCSWLEIILAFAKPSVLKKVFPPQVTGITVFLIGAALIGTGIKYWGGGVFCGDNLDVPCSGNGDVALPFGSSQYIGLGFSVFAMLVFLEIFGSPFLRSINVVVALLFGYFVASVSDHNGDRYTKLDSINSASNITFLWAYVYPLSVYPPLVLPTLLGFIVTTVETIADVTTTEEVSNLPVEGDEHCERLRGGLLGDGISSFIAALGTMLPNTTFSQNNGVIALTRCASWRAGIACGIWLFGFGILAKVAAFFVSIPDCVLGGMTTFLFANVSVSGIKVLGQCTTRRDRFIIACAMGLGLGVIIAPQWAENLWACEDCDVGLKSFRDGVLLILGTGYSLGCIVAIVLNLMLPAEPVEEEETSEPLKAEADTEAPAVKAEEMPAVAHLDDGVADTETQA